MDKIHPKYESYKPIYEEFGEEKIDKRYNELYSNLKSFIKKNGFNNIVCINEIALAHAIMDYFTDIYRLKKMHNIKKANEYKVIAYMVYWVIRRHPLQIPNEINDEDLIFINERFGTSYLYTELVKYLPKDYYQHLPIESQCSINGFLESLYYYLKFRTFTAQDLELTILSFYAGLKINVKLN